MAETSRLALPLVQAAQAQKHVTVNEAFERLDALSQLTLVSDGQATPPLSPGQGEVHGVGAGAVDAWTGHDGKLAVFSNGGWFFVTPLVGWRGWRSDIGAAVSFDGSGWIEGAGSISANGAGFVHRTVEFDHSVSAGATSTISGAIPGNSIVYGVTGRVLADIGGASSMEIGVGGSSDRYGSGIGLVAGSWARGLTGTPLAYYSDTDVILTSSGGAFDGAGSFRIAVHFAELTLPRG